MKKILCSMFAISFIIACNTTSQKKSETPVNQEKDTLDEKSTDLTSFGIKKGEKPLGLQTGEKAPDVTLTFQDGTQKNLSELYQQQPLVVFFYRGYWCPYCSQYLSEMATEAKQLELLGAKLIAITPETYENVDKTKANTHAAFDIVSDVSGAVMEAFKVDFDVTNDYQEKLKKGLSAGLESLNSSNEAVLPIPATYVIDQKGQIVYSFTNPDYKQRAPIGDILKHIPATH